MKESKQKNGSSIRVILANLRDLKLFLPSMAARCPEIDADLLSVIIYKASHLGENILVEDTSLEIEDAQVDIHVRWLLEHLPKYVGKKSVWRVLLAYHQEGIVYVYQGMVQGTIVTPRGKGEFGFDPVFCQTGQAKR